MAWPAITRRNMALAGVALALNLLLLAWVGVLALYSLYFVPFYAMPAALFWLRESPVGFRALAALLGVVYTGLGVWSFFFGGVLLVPSGLALLAAAALPPARRGVLVGTVLTVAAASVAGLAAGLILLAL
jgi:hypothetical protein